MKSDTTISVTTPRGTFVVDRVRDKMLSHNLRPEKHHQEAALALLERFLDGNSIVVDAGAHIGTLAVPLARKVARVIAFEPSPQTYALLLRNISLNGVKNVDPRLKGLGSTVGSAELAPMPEGNAGGQVLNVTTQTSQTGSIQIGTLDTEINQANLIKMDVEGMELDILRGATRILHESKPVLFFEVNIPALKDRGARPADIADFLVGKGYDLFFQQGNGSTLGRVRSLWLVAFLISPGSFLLGHPFIMFDILALPKDRRMPAGLTVHSWPWLISRLFILNIGDKLKRLKAFFQRS